MSKLMETNPITVDYAWSQFVEVRRMNKLLDELYNELDRRNKREHSEYEYDYEMDDDD